MYATTSGYPGYENGKWRYSPSTVAARSAARTRKPARLAVATVDTRTQTLGQILQPFVDASAWGQQTTGSGQGGWIYSFRGGDSDGSTAG